MSITKKSDSLSHASYDSYKPMPEVREGDWVCVRCSNFNFSFRNTCKYSLIQAIDVEYKQEILISLNSFMLCLSLLLLKQIWTQKRSKKSKSRKYLNQTKKTILSNRLSFWLQSKIKNRKVMENLIKVPLVYQAFLLYSKNTITV